MRLLELTAIASLLLPPGCAELADGRHGPSEKQQAGTAVDGLDAEDVPDDGVELNLERPVAFD